MMLKAKAKLRGEHYHVGIWMGKHSGALGKCGEVVFREDEWPFVKCALRGDLMRGTEVIIEEFGGDGAPILPEDLFVNIYLTDREYGGPEEGGWWYDVGEPICSTPADSQKEAELFLRCLEKWCETTNKDEDRRPPSSMASNGYYLAMIQKHPARAYPEEAPSYS